MSADNKVPAIRFKGFSADWDEKVLGQDVADIVGGGTPSTQILEYWGGDIHWYSPTEIGDSVYAKKSQKRITQVGLEKSSARILPANRTILFTSRAGIGDMAILSNEGCTNQGFQSLVMKTGYDTYFLYSMGYQIKDYALKHASGSTFLEISGKQLSKMSVQIPQNEEQIKIGNYFQQLDTLIAQHQQKHDKLLNLKKALLEKCFPQQGQTQPAIRFKGFSGEWEEKALGEVVDDLYNGQTPSRNIDSYWNGNINWLSSGELNRAVVKYTIEKVTLQGKKSAHLRVVPKETFVMAITGLEAVGTRGNCAILGIDTTLNQSCMAIFPNPKLLQSNFLFQWYRMKSEEYGLTYTQGTKQQSYNAEIIKKLSIVIPQIKEQNKISSLLMHLDTLINQHQAQLNKLGNIKQACLAKMFV